MYRHPQNNINHASNKKQEKSKSAIMQIMPNTMKLPYKYERETICILWYKKRNIKGTTSCYMP